MMRAISTVLLALPVTALLCLPAAGQPAPQNRGAAKAPLYNTAKQKLLEGKQVFSYTQSKFDVQANCEAAKHYDYTWYEMQHSTLEFKDVEAMIAACPRAGAIPMVRLPDAQEWHIQHATDIGALGIIVPTVDDVDRAREASKWTHYPPQGRRSAGGGQFSTIWGRGSNYRETYNDNVLLVVMIETPAGVANAYDIASVPGVDVVIIGNADLASFSGFAQGSEEYNRLVTKVHDDVKRAGKIFGQANASYAKGHPLSNDSFFFQNGPSLDGWAPAGRGVNPNAPPPGEESGPAPAPAGGRGRGGRG